MLLFWVAHLPLLLRQSSNAWLVCINCSTFSVHTYILTPQSFNKWKSHICKCSLPVKPCFRFQYRNQMFKYVSLSSSFTRTEPPFARTSSIIFNASTIGMPSSMSCMVTVLISYQRKSNLCTSKTLIYAGEAGLTSIDVRPASPAYIRVLLVQRLLLRW